MSRPSLSIPFRTPSPSPSAIQAQRPRPSLSSQSSARSAAAAAAEFEAALLNPGHTVFLSGSPALGSPEEEGALSVPGPKPGPGAAPGPPASASGKKSPGRTRTDAAKGKEGELNEIREERSYEDDLRDLSRHNGTPRRPDATSSVPAGRAAPGVGVIPPTPTTMRGSHGRKGSEMSTDSGESRLRKPLGPSLGIDAELNEPKYMAPHKNKTSPSKRRSIFRSPGTASSPDLATLVQRAKSKPGEPLSQSTAQGPAASSAPTRQGPTPASSSTKPSPAKGITPSQSFASTNTVTSFASAQSTQASSKPSPDSWEAVSAGTGSSGYRRDDGRSRANSGETDGYRDRSIGSRAKGLFGKMFGSSSSREPSGSVPTTPTSSSRFSQESSKSPVPSVPSKYAPSTTSNTRTVSAASGVSSRLGVSSARLEPARSIVNPNTPPRHARISTESTAMSVDKPLPGTPEAARLASNGETGTFRRNGGHSRQPADDGIAEESEPDFAGARAGAERGPDALGMGLSKPTWKDEADKILDDIGDERAAEGLGISHASVRRKRDPTPTDPPGSGPPATPREKETAVLLSTPPERDLSSKREKSPHVTPRTTSLARTPDATAPQAQAPASASFLSATVAGDEPLGTSLPSRSSSLSRNNSTSSRRRPKPARSPSGSQRSQTLPSDPAVPIRGAETLADFGPALATAPMNATAGGLLEGEDEATLRSRSSRLPSLALGTPVAAPTPVRTTTYNLEKSTTKSSLSPGSIRLVTPQPADPDALHADIASSAFRASSPWGAQSVHSLHSRGAAETPAWSPGSETQGWPGHEQVRRTVSGGGAGGGAEQERGRKLACDFLEGRYDTVPAERVAEFLGGPREINQVALKYYMQYFDMTGQTLVEAFRDLCQKLHLKAESQEIDRILAGFSVRYFECNPSTVFATPDVVHTVTGAMLMLNTDLHIADIVKRMSRSDFVRNALRAVQESLPASARAETPDVSRVDVSDRVVQGKNDADGRSSTPSLPVQPPAAARSASAPVSGVKVFESGGSMTTPTTSTAESSGVAGAPFVYTKAWELETENALKDIYNQVRNDRILLPISGLTGPAASNSNRQSMISVASGRPERTTTARTLSGQSAQNKRASMRGPPTNWPYGGTYSISDGRLSPQSPQSSFSASIDGTIANMAPTIGFASNLSHAVIKEHEADDETGSIRSAATASTLDTELDEDELALLGAPWAKEGILSHKPITDKGGKKPKSRDWKQYFAVIQKGELFIFTFGSGSGGSVGGAMGGGNWLNNANAIATWNLIHAHAEGVHRPGTRMPAGARRPTLTSDRPNSFSLTLPGEEQMLFQAGTEELVLEWVQTCNYWAAKRSRQPLQGGVSNMEYGWNRVVSGDNDDLDREFDAMSVRSHRSNRSNLSKLGGTYGRRTFGTASGGQGVGDRVFINDWVPPMPAFVPSPLDEEAQLEGLSGYVRVLQEDLDTHKLVEEPMKRLYGPGSKNGSKARANWLARDRYLRDELRRYETYIDVMKEAIALRFKKQGEKRLEKSLKRSAASLHRRDSEADQLEQLTAGQRGRGDGILSGDGADFGGETREREETVDTITARRTGRR